MRSFSKTKLLCFVASLSVILLTSRILPSFQPSLIRITKANQGFVSKKNSSLNKRSCIPKKNVVFLKTHKTGGSTITNILNRFGESRRLTFILPKLGENRLDWPWFFRKDSFYPLNGSTPNILNNHARYNPDVMQEIMPNDTIYITIVRNPITQFESSFSYMTFDKILGMQNSTDPLEEFFKNPEQVLVNYVLTQDLRINSDRLKLIRNGMFYDLGLESKDFKNQKKIRSSIEKLDSQFDLVMITEYFEESLVLLKRLMCWEIDDVVFFRLKQRSTELKRTISKSLQKKIMQWSQADVQLYKHFNRTFWTALKNIGKDFWDEVNLLKAKNKVMSDLCLQQMNQVSSELFQTVQTKQYKLRTNIPYSTREMCKRMTWDEIKYVKHLRELQTSKDEKKDSKGILLKATTWLSNQLHFYLI
ncbi:galactose-3-O-sulfotransferase 2 isoform X1 [Hydra vulgaris]|uniref:Galactose-3-O-sulfotransferase 2 isoform X1 n=1 Tax=Hydra vulgaris TaxID=6087 RepID=A0ABM4CZ90_HYDVU